MLTCDRLRICLTYDSKTGVFRWAWRARKSQRNKIAGRVIPNGYRVIGIGGKLYYAHRLAWLYVHGAWPEFELDHKNRRRDDNWLANLREATVAQNRAYRQVSKNNKLKIKGVSLTPCGKFVAKLSINGKPKHLGTFTTAKEAARVFTVAHQALYGEFSPKV